MSSTRVDLKIEGSHATICFRTDGGMNILSADVLHSFGAIIAKVKKNPLIRTTAIQAEGKVFIAGADNVTIAGNFIGLDADIQDGPAGVGPHANPSARRPTSRTTASTGTSTARTVGDATRPRSSGRVTTAATGPSPTSSSRPRSTASPTCCARTA